MTVKNFVPWFLSALVIFIAIWVWGSSFSWHFAHLSIYQIFPVLGLIAFSTMWSQYIIGFLKPFFFPKVHTAAYFKWSGYLVLVAIVLHPSLLAYQRFRDGFGLPPGSELHYVMPGLSWVVLLGMLSLLVFLSYELRRWFDKRNWWHYVTFAVDAAMLAIFYHALRLGTQVHISWFRKIWWFYGLTFIATRLYAYYTHLQTKRIN